MLVFYFPWHRTNEAVGYLCCKTHHLVKLASLKRTMISRYDLENGKLCIKFKKLNKNLKRKLVSTSPETCGHFELSYVSEAVARQPIRLSLTSADRQYLQWQSAK